MERDNEGGSWVGKAVAAVAGLGVAAWAISDLVSAASGTNKNAEQDDDKWMKAPGKDGEMIRSNLPPTLIKWVFPPAGQLKLNTDSCSQGSPGLGLKLNTECRTNKNAEQDDDKWMKAPGKDGEMIGKKPPPKLIKWVFPPAGQLKLNTDGCAKGSPGLGGFGGVIRDDKGGWVAGFCGKLQSCRSLEAELWGIFKGLLLLRQRGLSSCIVESDSIIAISLILKGGSTSHPLRDLVEDSKFLLTRTSSSIQHTLREGNFCADWLANHGASQALDFVIFDQPPHGVLNTLLADSMGLHFERPS